jgi:transcriptional regulator with XRE-family HTH domain
MDRSATLGERIYKYRSNRGLSQLELSELLDVSRQSISKWETDVAVPELSKLIKMAEIFDISLDTLILGKEEESKEESIKEEPAPAPIAPIAEIRERSRIKTGFGFCFLGVGILLSFLILLLADDFLAAFILFVPFGVSAFFCLKQFRHAALWCFESWYCWIAAYFYYATGCHWNAWLPRLIHFSELGIDIQTIISLGFFILLVFFICMTVFVHRKEKFELSRGKQIVLAVITALALPLKHLALWLMQIFWFKVVANGDPEYYARVIAMNYRAIIPTLEFLIDLAFTVAFTACLVPTFYWLRGIIKNRKTSK